MGDVALAAPVIRAFVQRYPDCWVTLVTREKFRVFFDGIPHVRVIGADFDNQHKGFPGLLKLFSQLRTLGPFEAVLDIHQNLRSGVLKSLFRLMGVPCYTIDKGRADKKALTRRENKLRKPLPHSIDRYAAVFARAGYPITPARPFQFSAQPGAAQELAHFLAKQSMAPDTHWLGIAPFAQHTPKMWPFERFAPLLDQLTAQLPLTIFLFGGGVAEIAQLETLRQRFPQAIRVAGQLSLSAELALIQQLNGMVCMDSGNMHLAALSGTPVLSIWGATHPDAGFGPWGQGEEAIVQLPADALACRPCSVFGNKPCWRGDLACLYELSVDTVAQRAVQLLTTQD